MSEGTFFSVQLISGWSEKSSLQSPDSRSWTVTIIPGRQQAVILRQDKDNGSQHEKIIIMHIL